MESKEVLIIIPAYNEENNIASLIENIRSKITEVNILVIDDGSRDRTAKVAGKAGAIVLRLPFNMGYGAALQSGLNYALKNRYRYAVQIDADGPDDSGSIRTLLGGRKKENVG